jgi:hypothetical protein
MFDQIQSVFEAKRIGIDKNAIVVCALGGVGAFFRGTYRLYNKLSRGKSPFHSSLQVMPGQKAEHSHE